MTKPVTEEELQLKKRARRRLVGAIALVVAVAAILPMILDPDPQPVSSDINIQIPSPDAKDAAKDAKGKSPSGDSGPTAAPQPPEKAVVPPAEPKSAVSVPDKAGEKAEEKTAVKPPEKAPEKGDAKAPEKSTEKAAEKTAQKAGETAEKSPAKTGAGKFFIQVTAVSDADKAKQVLEQVEGAGVHGYTEEVAAGKGKVTRVRAGPFATREEAEHARAQLSLAGLEGKVAGN